MTKPLIREHNTETDEIIDREMTNFEFAEWEANQKLAIELEALEAQKAIAKSELLKKLGITEDEAKLLLS